MSASELNIRLEKVWIEGGYESPEILLAFEPIFMTWYLVIEDQQTILELMDQMGAVYIVKRSNCKVVDDIYYCYNVQAIRDYPLTDRQYFVNDNIVPIIQEFEGN